MPTYLLARMLLSRRAADVRRCARRLRARDGVRDVDRARGARVSVVRALLLADRARLRVRQAPRPPRSPASSPCSRSLVRSPQFATIPAVVHHRRQRALGHLARGKALPRQLVARRHARRDRPPDRRALPLQPHLPAARDRLAVLHPVLEEPHGRSRAARRSLVHDRDGDPADDRRPRLAAAHGAAGRPRLPRIRRLRARRRSSASPSTPPSRRRTSRPSSRPSARSGT